VALGARTFDIKLLTIKKFNGWHALSLEELNDKKDRLFSHVYDFAFYKQSGYEA